MKMMTGLRKVPGQVVSFVSSWAWHASTLLVLVVLYWFAPRQMPLIVYKAAIAMLGACGGYWLFVAFFRRYPEGGDITDRWQAVVLMCLGMLCMSMGA